MIHALRKEMLLQWRTRAQMMAVLVFGASSLLLFSFAVGPNAQMLRQFSAGFMWLGLLLSSTLTLAESFHAEMENRAMEGLLLLPASPRVIYYGKALANWFQLLILGCALFPVMVVLYLTYHNAAQRVLEMGKRLDAVEKVHMSTIAAFALAPIYAC